MIRKTKKFLKLIRLACTHPRYIRKASVSLFRNGIKETMRLMKKTAYMSEAEYQDEEIVYTIVIDAIGSTFEEIVNSVKSIFLQTFDKWEIRILTGDDLANVDERIRCVCQKELGKLDRAFDDNLWDRIEVIEIDKNVEIINSFNENAISGRGTYLLFLQAGTQLVENGLFHIYARLDCYFVDAFYADYVVCSSSGSRKYPKLLPDWSLDLFRGYMYTSLSFGVRKDVFEKIGGCTKINAQERIYDLMFRISENFSYIMHVDVPIFLEIQRAQYYNKEILCEHLSRVCGDAVEDVWVDENERVSNIDWKCDKNEKVSVIIPTKDHTDDLDKAITSIYERTIYPNYEIIVLNNNSVLPESYKYFEELPNRFHSARVVDAMYSFNWSKLNNHGIKEASGDVYIFLNNDVEIISDDWMSRLAATALQKDIGVVGPMLLYPDDTIQHAGVVLGMNGYADHVFKGTKIDERNELFVKPTVLRNVLACTGACYAISKETIRRVGLFNEDFIICGSDIEMCLRAYNSGLRNIYEPKVKLYHYESKSRDSYIPEIDFVMSDKCYAPYKDEGDPFYNRLLDKTSTSPKVDESLLSTVYGDNISYVSIPEIQLYQFEKVEIAKKRLNIIVPTVNPEHVFGGISSAIKQFDELAKAAGYAKRIITSDSVINDEAKRLYEETYEIVDSDCVECEKNQLTSYCDRKNAKLAVSENDIFVFTSWWSAYCIQETYKQDKLCCGMKPNTFVYLVQDYEPGFYAWSTRYILADTTYRSKWKHIAIYNSHWLMEFFDRHGYKFDYEFCFEPILNGMLKKHLDSCGKFFNKEKQILVYGRPSVDRNAFELIVEALRQWVQKQEDVAEWTIYSAGENHKDVYLGKGKILESVGKMTLSEYAQMLESTYAGISLMVSPHPSYPPLEMAAFGVKVVTNGYENKDLNVFSESIISLVTPSASNICQSLYSATSQFNREIENNFDNMEYLEDKNAFDFMIDVASKL